MKAMSQTRALFLIALTLTLSLAVAACSPDSSAGILSPELGDKLVAEAANSEIEDVPAPELLKIADLSDEEISDGLPAEFAAILASGDPANGESLTLSYGCIGCHSLDPEQQMTGPTWSNMGDTAVNRTPDESPALYLYNSIFNSNTFVVDGYPASIMPQNYNDIMSDQDIADLVSYLLLQHE